MRRSLPVALATTIAALGCQEPLADETPILQEVRFLAVQSQPAEADPGAFVELAALTAGPDGLVTSGSQEWSLCLAPKSAEENNSVSATCLEDGDTRQLVGTAGAGQVVPAQIPLDACATFGSEPPPPPPDELQQRPVDPDATGGYYQPILVSDENSGALALARTRISCALASAPAEIVREFQDRYTLNENPSGFTVEAIGGDGEERDLIARWDASSAESYVVFDPLARQLEDRREALTLTWYATGGSLESFRQPVEGDEARNVWSPEDGGATVIAVLRDDRGGVSWASFEVP